ncbi:MAG: hypothetical protein WCS45_05025, partial [Clostridia bacterium]
HRRSVFAAKRQKNLLVRVMSRFRNGSGNNRASAFCFRSQKAKEFVSACYKPLPQRKRNNKASAFCFHSQKAKEFISACHEQLFSLIGAILAFSL